MAHTLPPFPNFNLQATDANNIGLEWAKWVERFENFIIACNITSDTRKKALLLHYAGEEVFDIFRSLPDSLPAPSTATSTTAAPDASRAPTSEYAAAKAKLDAHFAPRVNPTFSVYRFRQAQQDVGESLDAFYARLRQLSRHATFPTPISKSKTKSLSLRHHRVCGNTRCFTHSTCQTFSSRDGCSKMWNTMYLRSSGAPKKPYSQYRNRSSAVAASPDKTRNHIHDRTIRCNNITALRRIVATVAAIGHTTEDVHTVQHGAERAEPATRWDTLPSCVARRTSQLFKRSAKPAKTTAQATKNTSLLPKQRPQRARLRKP